MRRVHAEIVFHLALRGSRENLILIFLCAVRVNFPDSRTGLNDFGDPFI